jgi:hypothetical protein
MGLLDAISDILGSQKSESTDSSTQATRSARIKVNLPNIEYSGDRYYCEYSESENGEWNVAYGRSYENDEHRVFLLRNQGLQFTKQLTRIEDAKVADTGDVLIIDGGDREELSGKAYVFSSSGEERFSQGFEANVGACTISSDGDYMAVATLNPDCTTYIFDLDEGEQVVEHENLDGNKMVLDFQEEGEGLRLFLAEGPDSDPFYAIDLSGEVVWRSDELERQQRLQTLMDSSETDDLEEALDLLEEAYDLEEALDLLEEAYDLEEALDLLEEAYDLAEGENERKNVAQKLADTHWNLAKEIDKEEEDSDEWWQHLNQAKTYYTEVLPWYDGKQGVAKVSRKQGKYYLDQGEEEAALEMFQNIADLEKEYDVQLLTDADERKIEDLS